VFEGIGVSSGSLIGGMFMDWYGGSLTFRYYSIAFAVFFAFHVIVQWLLTRIYGPYGKTGTHEEIAQMKDTDSEKN
jgi:hypothetical protein